ncbi:MAG: RluA family pseudouridine synthase [Gammaproteobacteria bacterium]|nr:RluA family pseudouridine synthase [Gammaproteobacteria bacterium]
MPLVSYVTIPADYSDQRIDNFLFKINKNIPKSHIYRAIRKGEVRVNKRRVRSDSRVQGGDIVRIPPFVQAVEEKIVLKPSQHWLALLKNAVIYEDDGLLVVNKPSGLSVHGDHGYYGVIEVMKALYPQYPDLELAHRLDKETSGCLLMAKKRSMLKYLHEAFRAGKVKKTYYALTLGAWKKSELSVSAPLSRSKKTGPECQVTVDKVFGKPSQTRFVVAEQFVNATAVFAYPKTGRTHQIRVHARHVGHPLAGDTRYGSTAFNELLRQKGLGRLFLHALTLSFFLPDNQRIKLYAPLPSDLTAVLTGGLSIE